MTSKDFMDYLIAGRSFEKWKVNAEDTFVFIRLNDRGDLVDENDEPVRFPDNIDHWRLLPEPRIFYIAIDSEDRSYLLHSEEDCNNLIKDREESYNAQIILVKKVLIRPEEFSAVLKKYE